jgi:hypothetical protein
MPLEPFSSFKSNMSCDPTRLFVVSPTKLIQASYPNPILDIYIRILLEIVESHLGPKGLVLSYPSYFIYIGLGREDARV